MWRRLAAAVYDGLLLLALWMVALWLELVLRDALGLDRSTPLLRVYLFLVGLGFFGWCWTHGGQTLGMRAWRLQLRRVDGQSLVWRTAVIRYVMAWVAWLPLGLGVLWSALDARRRSWHDTLSGTEVILLPAKAE